MMTIFPFFPSSYRIFITNHMSIENQILLIRFVRKSIASDTKTNHISPNQAVYGDGWCGRGILLLGCQGGGWQGIVIGFVANYFYTTSPQDFIQESLASSSK